MTIPQLRELYENLPFRPFSLHLPDGRQVDVEHPDYASLSQTGRLLFVTHADDSESIVDVLLVSDITIKPPAPPKAGER